MADAQVCPTGGWHCTATPYLCRAGPPCRCVFLHIPEFSTKRGVKYFFAVLNDAERQRHVPERHRLSLNSTAAFSAKNRLLKPVLQRGHIGTPMGRNKRYGTEI